MPVRQSVLNGSWYPASAEELGRQVDEYLAAADPEKLTSGRPVLALSPHAGYAYSGPTAGKLFGLLKNHPPQTVIMLAPNHRLALDRIALSNASAFATPLGQVELDTQAVDQLNKSFEFHLNDEAHAREHAIEILLPFLQRAWPGQPLPAIVPLLVPRMASNQLQTAAQAVAHLRQNLAGETLLLVSTDFTHFGAAFGYQPFDQDIPRSLEKLDSGAILRVLKGDVEALLAYGTETGITMCGLPAAAVALGSGLPAGFEAGLIDYSRSADRDGDFRQSVSYASVLFTSGSKKE